MVRDGRIAHSGDKDLEEHVTNANAQTAAKEDTRLRFVQRNDRAPIDLLVSASMATKRCLDLRM